MKDKRIALAENKATINSKGKILTSSDEVLFDSEDLKTLSNRIDDVNQSLTEYSLSTFVVSNLSTPYLNIAYGNRFTNINFVGASLLTGIAANTYTTLISSFNAYTEYLNYTTIPIMVLNASSVPIGTATAIVFGGEIVLCSNIAISTTDKLYGCVTRWLVR